MWRRLSDHFTLLFGRLLLSLFWRLVRPGFNLELRPRGAPGVSRIFCIGVSWPDSLSTPWLRRDRVRTSTAWHLTLSFNRTGLYLISETAGKSLAESGAVDSVIRSILSHRASHDRLLAARGRSNPQRN